MPLRAKITNPAYRTQEASTMADPYAEFKEQPGDEPDDVLFNTLYGVRTIQLNRPKKYNALNGSMIRKIIPRLQEYQKSALASIVIIGGAGPKAFCAGGDVSALASLISQNRTTGPDEAKAYFGLEYRLDHLIATYPKPYVAYLDGITMGGGVGLSVHAPIRIATENTVFAMPETGIGFFPDVGGSFFLPRLEGCIGTYLALTSETLKGAQALYAGVATHYIDSSVLPNLTARLAELVFRDYSDLRSRLLTISRTIEEFNTGLPPPSPSSSSSPSPPLLLGDNIRRAIDYCFSQPTVEAIVAALETTRDTPAATNPHAPRDWAARTLATLAQKSPTSLKVALRQMRVGGDWSTADAFRREYHIAAKFMRHPDFVAGVSARLLHKPPTTPVWQPPALEDVSDGDVDAFFRIEEGEEGLELLTRGLDYEKYPYERDLGLPREEDVEEMVRGRKLKREQVVKELAESREGKIGVREKVEEVLRRKCGKDEDGSVTWTG